MNKNIIKNIVDPIKNTMQKIITPAALYKCHNNDNYIRMTAAFNFGLLCAAQSVLLSINPEIPEKVKKFLVPSEIIEGIIKISVFLFVATGFSKIGKNILVGKGIFLPEGICPKGTPVKEAAIIVKNILANKGHHRYKELKAFQDGMGNITNIVGSIVGLSIAVPPIRNKIATAWKDKMMTKAEQEVQSPTSHANFRYKSPALNPSQIAGFSAFSRNFSPLRSTRI
jgi:hypothetical protein